ncbi:MAG: hypothetical protein M3458_21740 [Acidobacteriota bacterium]|nr:hypothetical protein [Acidobacteriota bacterium]
MRKLTILTLTLGIAAIALVFTIRHSVGTKLQEKPQLTKDGSVNPDSIPDWVAYESFFGSLYANPDKGEQTLKNARSFAGQTGLKDTEVDSLLFQALNFHNTVGVFDKQIMDIKDRTWPNPGQEVWTQLKGIQRQKETAIAEFATTLQNRLGSKAAAKLRSHINERVKRQVKGFADKPVIPGQHARPHHSMGMALATFFGLSSFMQMGDGTVYLYSETSYTPGADYVNGYGSVSSGGDSYGHTYNVRTEMYGYSCGTFTSGGGGVSLSIFSGETGCDGQYSTTAIAEQYCPMANSTNDAGSSTSSATVAPFLTLNPFGSFNPDVLGYTGEASSTIPITVTMSTGGSAQGNLQFSYVASGTEGLDVTITGGGVFSINPGQRLSFNATYDPVSGPDSIDLNATARLSSPSSTVVQTNTQTSTSTLRIRR